MKRPPLRVYTYSPWIALAALILALVLLVFRAGALGGVVFLGAAALGALYLRRTTTIGIDGIAYRSWTGRTTFDAWTEVRELQGNYLLNQIVLDLKDGRRVSIPVPRTDYHRALQYAKSAHHHVPSPPPLPPAFQKENAYRSQELDDKRLFEIAASPALEYEVRVVAKAALAKRGKAAMVHEVEVQTADPRLAEKLELETAD